MSIKESDTPSSVSWFPPSLGSSALSSLAFCPSSRLFALVRLVSKCSDVSSFVVYPALVFAFHYKERNHGIYTITASHYPPDFPAP